MQAGKPLCPASCSVALLFTGTRKHTRAIPWSALTSPVPQVSCSAESDGLLVKIGVEEEYFQFHEGT